VADRDPTLRAILLGASNLRAALPTVVEGIRRKGAGPAEVLAACGRGRSYGTWSQFLYVRRLPGIVGCDLWKGLEEAPPPRRTLALVTDIGNDLVYGARVEEIAAWVGTCLEWLTRLQAEIVLTLLPLSRLQRLSSWEVRLATSILFPGRSVPWPGLLEQARDLDEHLRRLGREAGAQLVEPAAGWYGIDPIHFRRSVRGVVWSRVLSLWPSEADATARSSAGRIWVPLFGAAEMRLFGRHLRTPQPAVHLADGTTLSLY
jgi:hypothetical protein